MLSAERSSTVRHWAPFATLLASFVAYLAVRSLTHASSFDLDVYRAEGEAVRHGSDLYGLIASPLHANATYPPFAAVLFVPLTTLPVAVMHTLVLGLNLTLLIAAAWLSCRLSGLRGQQLSSTALLLAAVAVWAEPVFTTLRYGQINLLILVLVLWDVTRPASAATRGVGIGLAAGLKVTPALFVVYLLITGRRRAAATAVATFAATAGLSLLVVPGATWRYWTYLVFSTDRVGGAESAANQSMRGLFVRLDHTRATVTGEVLAIGVLLIVGLWCSALAYRQLGEAWGACTCAVTALLCAPIAWTHHWVWCVPIAALLWTQRRRWWPVAAVFGSYLMWLLPHRNAIELRYDPLQTALSAPYVVTGIAFLVLTIRLSYIGVTAASHLTAAARSRT